MCIRDRIPAEILEHAKRGCRNFVILQPFGCLPNHVVGRGLIPVSYTHLWLGFPVAYIFAMCCDWFVASPLAKGFAFKYLVTPGKSSPLAMTLAVSSCMVVPMVIIMSLYGACELSLIHI